MLGFERRNVKPHNHTDEDTKARCIYLKLSTDEMWELNTLPSSIFTCKSLETLILEGDLLVRVPSLASLPILESLNLKGVNLDVMSRSEN